MQMHCYPNNDMMGGAAASAALLLSELVEVLGLKDLVWKSTYR